MSPANGNYRNNHLARLVYRQYLTSRPSGDKREKKTWTDRHLAPTRKNHKYSHYGCLLVGTPPLESEYFSSCITSKRDRGFNLSRKMITDNPLQSYLKTAKPTYGVSTI